MFKYVADCRIHFQRFPSFARGLQDRRVKLCSQCRRLRSVSSCLVQFRRHQQGQLFVDVPA